MPESGTKETSGGITTGTTGTIIDGTTAKTAGTGAGELKGMRLIVPSTNSTERSRGHTGGIATNIRIVTIAASSQFFQRTRNRCADIARLREGKAMRQVHRSAAITLAIILIGIPARSQSVPSSQASANDLARRVITNELKFQDSHTNWMYRLEKEEYGKKQVEEIIETKEGSLSRLLSINDHPLTVKQQEEEDQRVQELMTSPSAKRKLQRALDAETLQGRRLFKMLPDAFVFNYAGGDGNLAKLSFRPNPNFHPPSLEARVFHDMEGEMWVDCKQERLAAFNGQLKQDVNFGFGLLGHLNKGGHFEVRQAEVVPGHWDMTTMSLEMTGKALLFKSIGVQKRENRRDFRQVSDDLTLTQAADMLNRHIVVADNR
jgi:hypothetical protein